MVNYDVESDEECKGEQLQADVESYSEVHAHIAELGERDLRREDVSFNLDAGLVTIDDGQTFHRVDIGEIVYWYKPREF